MRKPNENRPVHWSLLLALALPGISPAAIEQRAAEPLDERESYAFARSVEGEVHVAPAGQGVGERLERNQPLLTGDVVSTDRDSRAEILLPDRNRLTLDLSTTVRLESLAYSGDQESRHTVLVLEEGGLLLEVTEEALGDELPRIESGAATVYVQEPGLYRLRADGGEWLELVTREGYAEMVTTRGSTIVRSGEAAEAGADRWGRIELAEAGPLDAHERWSRAVARATNRDGDSRRYLDAPLAYASTDLDEHGDWVVHQSVRYWRPRVSGGWRPYWDGRWTWTPSGYTWVSYEPWGWVPYHYGRWCLVHGLGWVWRPGSVYSPAWVYWHWSDGYAGWCPTGFYTDYYSPWYRGGFRWGVYGWAGGSWGNYSHWNFAPRHCFRSRDFRGHLRRADDLRRDGRWPEVPRGLVTTDTRDFRPDRIDRPDQILHRIRDRELDSTRGELPDVTDFVGRRRDLPPPVVQAIAPPSPEAPRLRIDRPRVDDTPGWREERGASNRRIERAPRLDGPVLERPESEAGRTPRAGSDGPKSGDEGLPGAPGERRVRSGAPRVEVPSSDPGSRQGWKDRRTDEAPSTRSGRTPAPPAKESDEGGDAATISRPRPPVERVIGGARRTAPPVGDDSADDGSEKTPRSTRSPTPGATGWQRPADAAPRVRSGGDSGATTSYDTPRTPRSGGGRNAGGSSSSTPDRPAATSAPERRSRSTVSKPPASSDSGGSSGSTRSSSGEKSRSSGSQRSGSSSSGSKKSSSDGDKDD